MLNNHETGQGSLTVVIGLPGAGKSTFLQHLIDKKMIDVAYDDYQRGAPEEAASDPAQSPNFADLKQALLAGKRVAIADIRYVIPSEAIIISAFLHNQFAAIPVQYAYFANDPVACRHNVQHRQRPDRVQQELQFIVEHTADYSPPANQTIPVIMG